MSNTISTNNNDNIGTGGSLGEQNGGTAFPNSGGINNFVRLLEDWTDQDVNILGSFVSLDRNQRSGGSIRTCNQNGCHYRVPNRNFNFDTRFNDPENLPPGALAFVYLRQILFTRDFEID